jgi:hypothetical protein
VSDVAPRTYGEAVFGHADVLSTLLGSEVSIRQLGCGCYWLHAPVPDPASYEAVEAAAHLNRIPVPYLAHRGASGSHLRAAIHRDTCRDPVSPFPDGLAGRRRPLPGALPL